MSKKDIIDNLFTENNTIWEVDGGEDNLVYVGDIEELAQENGLTVDEVYDALAEYEDASRDLIETEREIEEARKGNY